MTNDNRTNEPTPEQVEAAAKALAGGEKWFWEYPNNDQDRAAYRKDARAALVAAQGAAPQAESERQWNDPSDPNSPQFDSPWEKAAALIQSIRGAQWDMLERRDQADVRDEINGLIDRLDELATTMLAAPALPSSGVDDDARTVAGYQALAEDPDYQAHQQLRRDSLALAWDRGRVAGLSEARDLVLGITTHAANPYKRGENDE